MKKKLRLSKVAFVKAEKVMNEDMKNVKAATLNKEACTMFCSVCGDSIGELIYFLPTTDSGNVPGC